MLQRIKSLISFLLSGMPLCSLSRRCNCTLWCTPQASFSEHNHVPKTQLPGALRCTSWGPRSHPENEKIRLSLLIHPLIKVFPLVLQQPWSLYYLTRVLSSLQVASTDHVFSDLKRICIKACVITQERDFQALQLMRVPCWKRQIMNVHSCIIKTWKRF